VETQIYAWKPMRYAVILLVYSAAFHRWRHLENMSLCIPVSRQRWRSCASITIGRLRFRACGSGCDIPSLAVNKMSQFMYDIGRRKHERFHRRYENSEDTEYDAKNVDR
jgi:hypothetical protein